MADVIQFPNLVSRLANLAVTSSTSRPNAVADLVAAATDILVADVGREAAVRALALFAETARANLLPRDSGAA